MSQAFAQNNMTTVVKKGSVVGQAPVKEGNSKTVPAVAGADVKALVKRGEERNVKVAFNPAPLTAPVRAGQPAGMIAVQQNGQAISKVAAVAGTAVAKQPWWRMFWPF